MANVPKKLGNVGTVFLFEDKRMRAWLLRLEPGQSSDWHKHSVDYVIVVTEPGTIKVEYEDGTMSTVTYELGDVEVLHPGQAHKVTNIGKARYCNAIIELK